MCRLALYVSLLALLGAAIGAASIFILAERLPEGAVMGALLGGSIGAFTGARIDAWRSARAFAMENPAAAKRSAALLSARARQIRAFESESSNTIAGLRPARKLEDLASRASQRGDAELSRDGESKR